MHEFERRVIVMRRVTMTENENMTSFMISDAETPFQILSHFHIDPNKNLVFINGSLLPITKMNEPISNKGHIFMSVRRKTV